MKKSHIVLLHIIFWMYLFGWHKLIGQFFSDRIHFNIENEFSLLAISHYLLFPVIFYLNYLYVLPVFYKTKRYRLAWVGWVCLLALFIALRYLVQEKLFLVLFNVTNYYPGTSIGYYIFDNIYYGGLLIVMSFFIWLIQDLVKTEKEKSILQLERNSAEVSFLRSQVNPHFIFNTMNNIYSLVYHKSDKALPAIEKLSGIMRYVMKESNAEKIELSREVEYLSNFIELQSLRTKGEDAVQFVVEGNLNGKMIAPLLLIPFVENGFKHGDLSDAKEPFVIGLKAGVNSIEFSCRNKISTGKKDHSSGIGLQNVKRRLELLYPGNYQLESKTEGHHFITVLSVNL